MFPRRFGPARWLLAGVAAALLACGGSSSSTTQGPGGRAGWTVLVYVAADNNLEPFALENLAQLAAGGSSGVNLVAEIDRSVDYTDAPLPGVGDFTSTKRLEVRGGQLRELSDRGERDTADPAELTDFIAWGVKTYPADRYMLVLWDHGGGWQGYGADEDRGGAPGTSWMKLPDIEAGVRGGLAAAGLPRLDVIGFDACLMATLEVAELLRPHARYLLASEELEPGHGWDYRAFAGAAQLDAPALSRKIVDGYQSIASAEGTSASITLSVVDLDRLQPIESAVTQLSSAYQSPGTLAPYVGAVGRGRSATLAFGADPDPSKSFYLLDMGDLFGELSTPLGSTATAIQSAVQGAVVYQVKGSAYARATGLSIYFPSEERYYDTALYAPLPGMDAWRSFLARYYGAGAASQAPAFAQGGVTYDLAAPGGALFDGLLTPGSLASASSAFLAYGLPDTAGGGAWLFGDQPLEVNTQADGDHLTTTWDYTFMRLYQTSIGREEFGYLSIQQSTGTTAVASIPFHYYAPGSSTPQEVLRQLVYSSADGTVLSDAYYAYLGDASGGSTLGRLTPEPGSALRAVVAHLANPDSLSTEWLEFDSTGAFDATQPVLYDYPGLNSGAGFFAGLYTGNSAGQGDWVATSVTSPPVRP